MRAFIAAGRLYGEDLPAQSVLYCRTPEQEMTFQIGSAEEGEAYLPFRRYAVSCGGQECLLKDGIYEWEQAEERMPVPCIGFLRRPSCTNEKGQPYPFMDRVYPVIYAENGLGEIRVRVSETERSKDRENLPKILYDGNRETFGREGERAYAYPVEFREGDPYCIREVNDTGAMKALPEREDLDSKTPLKHGDRLEILLDGKACLTLYWDQISKVWYEARDREDYPMIAVKGGSYTMGDYRGKLYNYSFGVHNVNMKKNWENILDPEYMGEEETGERSVGKTGLREENSLAADKNSDFWCFNEDAVALHEVEVSDFYLGRYSVTMDEFYAFVDALQEDGEGLYYDLADGGRQRIHQIAAIGLSEKRRLVRDNGWGKGQRPVVNVCFSEIAEYCNWLSRQKGYEPCYDIRPIFAGQYGEGLSECNLFRYEEGSAMQIRACRGEKIQLVEIVCRPDRNGYRLPYEAEFEYVIRGGEHMPQIRDGKGELYAGITGDTMNFNDDFSWQRRNTQQPKKDGDTSANLFNDNMGGNGYTSPVGTRLPNRMGFYDLSGGVWEIMNDIFSRVYFEECAAKGKIKDPCGPQYTVAQLGDMKRGNADSYMKGRYQYSYEKQEDGSYTRTKAVSLEASGKTHHVLRGGCFTNPLPFTSALHRHAAGGISYAGNFINHFNARTGFRLARSRK